MKNGKVCPKCGGPDIIAVLSADSQLNIGRRGPLPVERYLCLSCGYLESWMDMEAFERMGHREYWEKRQRAEESDRKFGVELAYYSEKARQEQGQPAKPPEEKKRRDDPWT